MESRIAVVTGAARGIGRAIAGGLARRGNTVALVDLLEPGETETAIAAAGGRAAAFRCDVSSPDAVDALRDQLHDTLGPCAILVNNAALLGSATTPAS